jgi:phosphoribosylamine--glycine ligase
MLRHAIPTAAYRSFTLESLTEGNKFLEQLKPPYVLKADGLAAGKGVAILNTLPEARKELAAMLQDHKFGAASGTVVIEEFLTGIELSVFILTDGKDYLLLPEAKDYKRIGEGDTGPNTGGMGAMSPVPFADAAFMSKVRERIIRPTIAGLLSEGIAYSGFIFFGLINVGGDPFLIEYNVRLGDPETEAIIPRISGDLLGILWSSVQGRLSSVKLAIEPSFSACVMLVAGGYPGAYLKDLEISGLDAVTESHLFHAGTIYKENTSHILTNGGRVIAISSLGDTASEALAACYRSAELICFDGINYRKDIGKDLEK